jgi:hypothetical protein
MNKIIYEYFINGVWIEGEFNELENRFDYYKLVFRVTEFFELEYRIVYCVGSRWHKLDGPAFNAFDYNNNLIRSAYWFDDRFVINGNDINFLSILQNAQTNVRRLKSLICLAEYNNWLNNKQLLLLKTLDVFV